MFFFIVVVVVFFIKTNNQTLRLYIHEAYFSVIEELEVSLHYSHVTNYSVCMCACVLKMLGISMNISLYNKQML